MHVAARVRPCTAFPGEADRLPHLRGRARVSPASRCSLRPQSPSSRAGAAASRARAARGGTARAGWRAHAAPAGIHRGARRYQHSHASWPAHAPPPASSTTQPVPASTSCARSAGSRSRGAPRSLVRPGSRSGRRRVRSGVHDGSRSARSSRSPELSLRRSSLRGARSRSATTRSLPCCSRSRFRSGPSGARRWRRVALCARRRRRRDQHGDHTLPSRRPRLPRLSRNHPPAHLLPLGCPLFPPPPPPTTVFLQYSSTSSAVAAVLQYAHRHGTTTVTPLTRARQAAGLPQAMAYSRPLQTLNVRVHGSSGTTVSLTTPRPSGANATPAVVEHTLSPPCATHNHGTALRPSQVRPSRCSPLHHSAARGP